MKRLLLLAVAALCGVALAQSRETFVPYRALTWADFPVAEPAAEPEAAAHTATRVRYEYRFEWRREDEGVSARVNSWSVVAHFDRSRSWRRGRVLGSDTALLAHEQGHFDISQCVALQQGQLRPDSFEPVTAPNLDEAKTRLERMVKERFEVALAEGDRRQRLYDKETRHGLDPVQQARWSATIAAEIKALRRSER